MFRRFAGKIPEGALALFKCHPLELTTLLEVAWKSRAHDAAKILGHPGHRSDIPPIPGFWLNPLSSAANIEPPTDRDKRLGWNFTSQRYDFGKCSQSIPRIRQNAAQSCGTT